MKTLYLMSLLLICITSNVAAADRVMTGNDFSNMATVIVAAEKIPRIESVFGFGINAKAKPATSNEFSGKRKLTMEGGIEAICDGKPSGGSTNDPNNCNVVINYEDRGKYDFFSVTAVKSQKMVTWLLKK